MKVLFTMTGNWGTGSGTVVEALSKHLSEQGHQVCILYPELQSRRSKSGARAPEARHEIWEFPIEEEGVELYTFPLMIKDPNPRNVTGAWTFKDLTEKQLALYIQHFQRRFKEVVASFQPDIIECHHIWLMPFAVRQLRYPYLTVAHHSDQMAYRFDERMRPYAMGAAQGSSHIFAVSEVTRDKVVDYYDVPSELVTVTGNGYDRTVFKPMEIDPASVYAKADLAIPPEAPVVTFAGKLSRTKGIDTLLLANRMLRNERQDVHFAVFGAGELDEALKAPEGSAGGPASSDYDRTNVHFIGHQPYETIAEFHNAARLSVMPSRTEGFGIAGLEAMGCGRPLVATRTGGLDRYAVGAVVEPEDEEALAREILRIIDLPDDHYETLCEDALAAARRFSWEHIAQQRLLHYRDM